MTPRSVVVAFALALLSGAVAAQDAGSAGSEPSAARSELQRAIDEVNSQTSGPAPVIRREAPGFFGPGFFIGVERVGQGVGGDRFGGHENATTYEPAESDALLRR